MAEVTGYEATNPDFQGGTPPSLRDALALTAINGLNRYVDAELADHFGTPTTQADVHAALAPESDPSQPKGGSNLAALLSTPQGIAIGLLAVAGTAFVVWRVLK